MRREVTKMIETGIIKNKVNDNDAAHEIIVEGLPSIGVDRWANEISRVEAAFRTIMDDFDKAWITGLQRFSKPSDDGTFPLKVTVNDKEVVKQMVNHVKKDPKKWPWFRGSKSRNVRKWNADQAFRLPALNSKLPAATPTTWENVMVGDIIKQQRVLVPGYVPPAATPKTLTTGAGNQRPIYSYPPPMLVAPVTPILQAPILQPPTLQAPTPQGKDSQEPMV